MDVRPFSLPELLRLAHRYGLLDDYTMAPDAITLYRGGGVYFEGDPVETRFFLMGLIAEHTRGGARVDRNAPPEPLSAAY